MVVEVRVVVGRVWTVAVPVIVGSTGPTARSAGIAIGPQPPAMAGSSRTSSAGATGVSSPAR